MSDQKMRRKPRPAGSPPVIEFDEKPCPVPGLVGPCHIFRGGKMSKGYGNVRVNGKPGVLVHRYVWQRDVGPIPPGLEIDHQCRVRACCNVQHLRVVTPKVNRTENSNSVGAKNKVKTHCPQGHPLADENVRINTAGSRVCRTCRRVQGLAAHHRKRGKK